jgi:hypothetical protein
MASERRPSSLGRGKLDFVLAWNWPTARAVTSAAHPRLRSLRCAVHHGLGATDIHQTVALIEARGAQGASGSASLRGIK